MRAFWVVLILIAVGVVGVGFYQDWFHLSVDTDKIAGDTQRATEAVESAGTRLKERVSTGGQGDEKTKPANRAEQTVNGVVKSTEPAANRFTMTTTDDKELTLYTDAASRLRHNDDDVAWDRLRARDTISVDYQIRDGKNMVIRVTITQQFAAAP